MNYVNDCSIETEQYLVREFKLSLSNDLSLVCVLKYFNSSDSCNDVYKENCGFISFAEIKLTNQNYQGKCLNSSGYIDSSHIYLGIIY